MKDERRHNDAQNHFAQPLAIPRDRTDTEIDHDNLRNLCGD